METELKIHALMIINSCYIGDYRSNLIGNVGEQSMTSSGDILPSLRIT